MLILKNIKLKAQESVQQSFNIVAVKGQQAIECAHLQKGVMFEVDSITGFIFGKIGINEVNIGKQLEKLIDTYPRVSGGEPYISSNASEAPEALKKGRKGY